MRTLTSFAAALVAATFSLGAQAQTLANLDLETWATRATSVTGGTEAPTNWQTTDDLYGDLAGTLPSSTATVTKTTDVNGGTYAAKIENKVYAPLQSFIPVMSGLMSLGSQISYTSDGYEFTGAPYTGRPTQIQFYYKLTGAAAAADSAAVFFTLTQNVAGTTQEVAFRGVLLPPAATYTLVTLPITYATTAVPDSVHLTFTSSNTDHPTVGTALFVDDITIGVATPTATRPSLQAALSVAPNPSATGRFSLLATEPELLAAPFTVLDATGRLVLQGAATSPAAERQLDLSAQKAGIYTLQFQTEKGVVARKLVVQ